MKKTANLPRPFGVKLLTKSAHGTYGFFTALPPQAHNQLIFLSLTGARKIMTMGKKNPTIDMDKGVVFPVSSIMIAS